MTRDDVRVLLADIRAAYPGFHRDTASGQLRRVVEVWADVLAHEDTLTVRRGLIRYIGKNRFAPSPAEVLEMARMPHRPWADRLATYTHEDMCGDGEHLQSKRARLEAEDLG